MLKHGIVGILTLLILFAMINLSNNRAYHGGEGTRVIQDIEKISQNKKVESDDLTSEKLKTLQDKVGNVGIIKVSMDYKSKCSSCHGIDARGIIGPNLVGMSQDRIYSRLIQYKSGQMSNPAMQGLLSNMQYDQLKALSVEISKFKEMLEKAQ